MYNTKDLTHKVNSYIRQYFYSYEVDTDLGIYLLENGIKSLDHALRHAVITKNIQLVKTVLDLGASVTTHNNYPLRWASELGLYDMTKLLIERGAIVSAKHNYAIKWASYNGYSNIVSLLLKHGANPCVENHFCIHWANVNQHHNTVKVLMEFYKSKKK